MWRRVQSFIAVWMIVFSTIGSFIIWITEPNVKHSHDIRSAIIGQRPFLTSRCTRQLQLWSDTPITPYSDQAFRFHCPHVPCEAAVIANTNISTTRVSDGVVFFPDTKWSWDEMHFARSRGQKWIFFNRENPTKTSPGVMPPEKYSDKAYDYVMTYRRESDFPAQFGFYDETKPELRADDDRIWTLNKTGIVFAPATHCQQATWNRSEFIKEFSSFIPVDIHHVECIDTKSHIDSKFLEQMKSYKFSLALEDSRCRDFITELFFTSLAAGTVPIVDGPPREDYEQIAPPHSFIHVADFNTVVELADYIRLLDKDDALYDRFFRWKRLGRVVNVKTLDLLSPENICSIFQRLHDDEMKEVDGFARTHRIVDWEAWWQGSCSF